MIYIIPFMIIFDGLENEKPVNLRIDWERTKIYAREVLEMEIEEQDVEFKGMCLTIDDNGKIGNLSGFGIDALGVYFRGKFPARNTLIEI